MVLSHGHGSLKSVGEMERDTILCQYADLLSHKASLTTGVGGVVKEGWELAVAILGRLDDSATAQRCVSELLDDIELTDDIRAAKVLGICGDLGLAEQARAISEVRGSPREVMFLASTDTRHSAMQTVWPSRRRHMAKLWCSTPAPMRPRSSKTHSRC